MNYLDFSQAKSYLNLGKAIEVFIGFESVNGHKTIQWITIEAVKDAFNILFHDVFDNRDEGFESIYDYSYVEPDDIYGKEVGSFNSAQEALEFSMETFNLIPDRFGLLGVMDKKIKAGSSL